MIGAEEGVQQALPEGWRTETAEDGRIFYINDATGSTQWDPPTAAATPSIPLTTRGNIQQMNSVSASPSPKPSLAPQVYIPQASGSNEPSDHEITTGKSNISSTHDHKNTLPEGYKWSTTYWSRRMYSMLMVQLLIIIFLSSMFLLAGISESIRTNAVWLLS